MQTRPALVIASATLITSLAIGAARAQSDSPATDLKPDPAQPGKTVSKAAESSQPAPASSIAPVPKPSTQDLATKSVVPLPTTGAAGVAPPAMPGAPNPAPPGAGSKP